MLNVSEYQKGMLFRLKNSTPISTNIQWLDGFNNCLLKISYIEVGLSSIVFELLAARELWENYHTLDHVACNDRDDAALRLRNDVHIGLKKIAVNAAILNATKLYEMTLDAKESKHSAPILQALNKPAFDAIVKKFKILDYTLMSNIRNKMIAHVGTVEFTKADEWMKRLIPSGDLSDFLEQLNPDLNGGTIGVHEAADMFKEALYEVPGYCAFRKSLE